MRFRTLGLTLLAAGFAVWIGSAQGGNWPRFRGPNGTGVADDKGIPVQWTDADYTWKTALPGVGHSSPIVWGDRIFLQSSSKDARERHLVCLNVADGKILWNTSIPGGKGKPTLRNSHASSTPATDGERVYTHVWDGAQVALYAFDFKGVQLWKHELGAYTSQHGAANSPLVHAGKVYLLNDHDNGSAVVALAATTGKKMWEAPRKHMRACYSTPFVMDRAGEGTELIVGTTLGVTGYDVETGAKNWQYDWTFKTKALRTVAAPALASGLIVQCSGDGSGDRHTIAVAPGSKASGLQPSKVWEHTEKQAMPYVPCFLSRGDHLYWVNDKGVAGCTVARTGETVWTERLGNKEVTSSPVLVDGKIYVVNEKGDVFVYPAEPKFQLLARSSLNEPCSASPAVADGRMFLRGETHLFCLGKGQK